MGMKKHALDYLVGYREKTQFTLDQFLNSKLDVARDKGGAHEKAIQAFIKISRGGKRIRGGLMYLGYLLGGGAENDDVLRATLASEVLHAGLLVQDDVFDRDERRRGEPTVHTLYKPQRYGDAMAIMVGDLAFSWALELLISSQQSSEMIVATLEVYTSYFEQVVWGQMSDVAVGFESIEITELQVLEIMKSKTAQYSAVMPLVMGMVLAGSNDDDLLVALKSYGINLGMAFQIQDDVLGIYGGEDIGKSVGSDISERKQTLMVVHFRSHASTEDKEKLDTVWGKDVLTDDDVDLVQRLFRESGSYDYAKERVDEYFGKSKDSIGNITEDRKYLVILGGLLDYVASRLS